MKTADAMALFAEALDRNTKVIERNTMVMEDMSKLTQSIDEFRTVLGEYPRKTAEAVIHGRAAAEKSRQALRESLKVHTEMMAHGQGKK